MENHLQGCGKDDAPLTLYQLPAGAAPVPIANNYRHIRCGYRPPSKIRNGILLCNDCIVELRLPILGDSSRAT